MYKCQKCGRQSKPKEKQYTKVVETREKYYKEGTTGWEIVRELKVCEGCKNEKI